MSFKLERVQGSLNIKSSVKTAKIKKNINAIFIIGQLTGSFYAPKIKVKDVDTKKF